MRISKQIARDQNLDGLFFFPDAVNGESARAAQYVIPISDVSMDDAAIVGGKNASLGEMLKNLQQMKIAVPDGFATTAAAYRRYISENRLAPVIADNLRIWWNGDASLKQ